MAIKPYIQQAHSVTIEAVAACKAEAQAVRSQADRDKSQFQRDHNTHQSKHALIFPRLSVATMIQKRQLSQEMSKNQSAMDDLEKRMRHIDDETSRRVAAAERTASSLEHIASQLNELLSNNEIE